MASARTRSYGRGVPRRGGPVAEPDAGQGASKTRLAIFYSVLAVITVTVAILVIGKGQDEHGLKSIAGGYDAAAPVPCLGSPPKPVVGPPLPPTAPAQAKVGGPSFDVKQSGQFVN